jgi:hypothetical protein
LLLLPMMVTFEIIMNKIDCWCKRLRKGFI